MIPFDRVTQHQVQAVNFGDKRLNLRFQNCYFQMEECGFYKSFPNIFCEDKLLKGFYELMNNEKVSPERFNDAYINGLIDYFSNPDNIEGIDYLFNYQDTTFGKYNNRKVELGYTETKDSNGVVIHSGILTGVDYIPLGIAHQQIILRDRKDYGKKGLRGKKSFEEKESYKWAQGLHWAQRFNQAIPISVVQVGDRECDIADFFNLANELDQLFIVRSRHDRRLDSSSEHLSTYFAQMEPGYTTERTLLDGKGKAHQVPCVVKYSLCQIKDIEQPIWVIHLNFPKPPPGMSTSSWQLLTNAPLEQGEQIVERFVDAYTKRWRTTEDFHKCLKSGCSIEERQFTNTPALLNMISMMSMAAVRLLRTRHMAEVEPEAPVNKLLDETEEMIAIALGEKYLKPLDLDYCKSQTVLWWTLLLGRMGGHRGYSQKGMPGWITLNRGWQSFQEIMKGVHLMKNIYELKN